jgi:hypothetical protein
VRVVILTMIATDIHTYHHLRRSHHKSAITLIPMPHPNLHMLKVLLSACGNQGYWILFAI